MRNKTWMNKPRNSTQKCLPCSAGQLALYALSLGYDGYLSLAAVIALFGGEKVLDRWINKEDTP